VSRVFVTGSADGLGRLAAAQLVRDGHEVVLHARSESRGREALGGVPGAAGVLTADLTSIAQTRALAERANESGRFDAVIHNAALGYQVSGRAETEDGLAAVFAVNVLAPYLLTALMIRPDRLIYMSSGMHSGGDPSLEDLQWRERRWSGTQAYSDSKLFDLALAFAVARRWPDVLSNAVTPGWVATKMGGAGAPDDWRWAPTPRPGWRSPPSPPHG
jgi:NAD(P)-dependent dehydrogenase (short-subunit alcohol dehydrogenase family)